MARIAVQDPETASGTNREIFASLTRALGKVPNMMRTMATSPALLRGYAQFSGALAGGSLPASIREQIALLVAQRNQCDYCLAAHAALGAMASLTPDDVAHARTGRARDAKATAALAFASAVLDQNGGVPASDVQAARSAGLSEAELAEVVGAVALNVLTNLFNRAFETDLDFPQAAPLRAARAGAPRELADSTQCPKCYGDGPCSPSL